MRNITQEEVDSLLQEVENSGYTKTEKLYSVEENHVRYKVLQMFYDKFNETLIVDISPNFKDGNLLKAEAIKIPKNLLTNCLLIKDTSA
jgi:hypothetical protein